MNRLIQQFARDGHLSFSKKWRDLIIQVFGNEGLYEQRVLAGTATCSIFDVDFYRLKEIKLNHLAYRKLLNPFKWLEFLVTAPIELLVWSLVRRDNLITTYLASDKKLSKKIEIPLKLSQIFIRIIWAPLNIAANIITGIIKRIIAPARYIIRPAIELAHSSSKTFIGVVVATLVIAAILTVTVFSGGLMPFIALATVATFAALVKAVSFVRELIDAVIRAIGEKSSLQDQTQRVGEINSNRSYEIYSLKSSIQPDKKALDKEDLKDQLPLLIKHNQDTWPYGAAENGETILTSLDKDNITMLNFLEIKSDVIIKKDRTVIPPKVYETVNKVSEHIRTTGEISRALHGINPELTQMQPIEKQNSRYTFALFTGTEALSYPKHTKKTLGSMNIYKSSL